MNNLNHHVATQGLLWTQEHKTYIYNNTSNPFILKTYKVACAKLKITAVHVYVYVWQHTKEVLNHYGGKGT